MTAEMTLLRRRAGALEAAVYDPASSVSEAALLRGYGATTPPVVIDRVVMAQLCVCGGPWIDPGVASEIPAAVAEHNATSRHLAWRERQDIR